MIIIKAKQQSWHLSDLNVRVSPISRNLHFYLDCTAIREFSLSQLWPSVLLYDAQDTKISLIFPLTAMADGIREIILSFCDIVGNY